MVLTKELFTKEDRNTEFKKEPPYKPDE